MEERGLAATAPDARRELVPGRVVPGTVAVAEEVLTIAPQAQAQG